MNKEQKERQRIKDLGTVFVTAILPEQWPKHLLHTFQKIRAFRKFDLSTFTTGDPPITPHHLLWRRETADRAKEIVAIVATLIEDAPVEYEWRLRLEPRVRSRFDLTIDCPLCSKRLWRSEVEAMVEIPGSLSKNLDFRRANRQPCQCPPEQRLLNLGNYNKVFSSRADEKMSFDSIKDFPKENIKFRRPDRILGFQQTNSFNSRLGEYDLMASGLQDDVGLETLREPVNNTVLNHKGNLLLFPFLIIEAKSRSGASFDACNAQTALPILKMLRLQEDLQAESQMTPEYGGPLVWYIAYKGEDWRLSACYISEKSGKDPYEINCLWSGLLNDGDSALQLLLIIDYIFDWARDVYKHSIFRQLAIRANPDKYKGHAHDDSFTATDTDSDVRSRAGSQHSGDVEAWCDAVEDSTKETPDEEFSLRSWATHDSSLGAFRPACIVNSFFQCILITKANIDALFSAAPKKQYSTKKLATTAVDVLNANHFLVSEDVLRRMEEIWTNRARPRQYQDARETRLFATITYRVAIDENWELKRFISCLAFDEEALNLVHQYSERKSTPVAIKDARRLGKGNAEKLLGILKNLSIQQNLASAIASKRQQLHTVAGVPSSSDCPVFEFVDTSNTSWSDKAHELIEQVYDWCKRSSEEPTEPYLRFSHQLSSLTSDSADSTVASLFPDSEPIGDEQCVLVAQYRYRHNLKPTLHLCLYVVPGLLVPTKKVLQQALRKAVDDDVVYSISTHSNTWKDVYNRMRTGNFEDIRGLARVWRHEMGNSLASSLYVKLSALETGPEYRKSQPLRRQIRLPSPSPSPEPEIEDVTKRPFEDTDDKEIPRLEKRIKTA